MRVLCLNGWGGKLHERFVAYLREADPDVLCLQEVVHSPETDKEWLTYRDGDHVLPQRANFLADVCAAMPGHAATFCPAAEGVLWDGDRAVPSQWGLATFVRRGIPVIGQVQGFVHKGFATGGFGEHPRSRPAHGVRLHDRDQNRAVCVLHMHGLRDLAGKHDTPERAVQARRLVRLAEALANEGDALVMCGDFNVGPDSETFAILASLGLRDLVTSGGHEGTRTSHYQKPMRFADYMLVNDAARPRAFEVVRAPEVSDHCPLMLTL